MSDKEVKVPNIGEFKDVEIIEVLVSNGKFISKNDLSFFQGNGVKYVCRYKNKAGIQDLEKIKHYCDLEIKHLKDRKDDNKKKN